jgi:D-methionine transport system permease protein
MVIISTIFAYLLGLPMGVALVLTQPHGIRPNAIINRLLGWIINIGRSLPFIILMIAIMDFTKLIVGTKIGTIATIPPMVIAAFPLVARMVESSLREVNHGVIEAAQSMGASTWQIVTKVLLPEALPSLISGGTITVGTILGYGAMAGIIGGGGLGKMAINYGYYNFKYLVMWSAVIGLILLVQIFQSIGTKLATACDKRLRNRS